MSNTLSSVETKNNPDNSVIVRRKVRASEVFSKISWLLFAVVVGFSCIRLIFHFPQTIQYILETLVLVIAVLPIVIQKRPLIINDTGLIYGGENLQWDRIKQLETVPWTRAHPPGCEVTLFQMSIFGVHRRFVIPNQYELQTSELTELLQQHHLRASQALTSALPDSKCRNGS